MEWFRFCVGFIFSSFYDNFVDVPLARDSIILLFILFYIWNSEHFGERAIITGEPFAGTVLALTDVRVWTIPKERFQAVVGHLNMKELILKESDKKLLSVIPLFAYSDIDSIETGQLADLIEDATYEPGHVFATKGAMVEPALYIIRTGSVVRDGYGLLAIFDRRLSHCFATQTETVE